MVLANIFEKERKKMLEFHQKKGKKNKVSKKLVTQLTKLKPENKELLLKTYMQRIGSQNMIAAI